jgi:hypothetical protein
MTTIIEMILNAFFTGIGVTIGTYIAQRHLIGSLEKIVERIKKKNEKKNSRLL